MYLHVYMYSLHVLFILNTVQRQPQGEAFYNIE